MEYKWEPWYNGQISQSQRIQNLCLTVSNNEVQWNPSGKARNVSLKLQNLVHFHAPFFTNHVYFTPHDRPPLLKGHPLGWPKRVAFIEGFHCIWYVQPTNKTQIIKQQYIQSPMNVQFSNFDDVLSVWLCNSIACLMPEWLHSTVIL